MINASEKEKKQNSKCFLEAVGGMINACQK